MDQSYEWNDGYKRYLKNHYLLQASYVSFLTLDEINIIKIITQDIFYQK